MEAGNEGVKGAPRPVEPKTAEKAAGEAFWAAGGAFATRGGGQDHVPLRQNVGWRVRRTRRLRLLGGAAREKCGPAWCWGRKTLKVRAPGSQQGRWDALQIGNAFFQAAGPMLFPQ